MVVDQDNKNLDQALNLIVGENNVTINENVESAIKLNDQVMAGPSNNAIQKKRVVDQNLVLRLIEMFPEACPVYIRSVCGGRQWTDLDDVVTVILSSMRSILIIK